MSSGEAWAGRQRSTPGTALNVAACSVTTRAAAERAAGAREQPAQLGDDAALDFLVSQAAKLPGGTDDDLHIMFARRRLARG